MSLRLRLFLSFLLIVLITTVSIIALTTVRIREDVVFFLTRGGLSGNAQLVEELEAYYSQFGSWENVEIIIQRQRGGPGNPMGMSGNVTLADANGQVVASRGQFMGNQGQGPGNREVDLTETELGNAIQLYKDDELIGYLVPELRIIPMPGIESTLLQRLTRSALFAAGIAVGLSIVLSMVLAYVLLRPIRDLTGAAEAMGKGDLSQRVQPRGQGETAILAKTFNEMADSLEKAEDRRRALTADIAHELRNPLAIQRANLEAMQDGLYPLSADQLEPIRQQNLMLERLVEDLRTLALADTGQLSLNRMPVDIPTLLRRTVSDLKPEADLKNIRIKTDLPEQLNLISVDPARIGQIFTNLIANALRFSPEESEILIQLRSLPAYIQIDVRDHGPGISEVDLPKIFERFYRGDKSRNRGDGNTGLGLSIARRLAQAHNGDLAVKNHPDGGAVFTLTLPV